MTDAESVAIERSHSRLFCTISFLQATVSLMRSQLFRTTAPLTAPITISQSLQLVMEAQE